MSKLLKRARKVMAEEAGKKKVKVGSDPKVLHHMVLTSLTTIRNSLSGYVTVAWWRLGRDLADIRERHAYPRGVKSYQGYLTKIGIGDKKNRWIASKAKRYFNHLPQNEERVKKMTSKQADDYVRAKMGTKKQGRLSVETGVKMLRDTTKRLVNRTRGLTPKQRTIVNQITKLIAELGATVEAKNEAEAA